MIPDLIFNPERYSEIIVVILFICFWTTMFLWCWFDKDDLEN